MNSRNTTTSPPFISITEERPDLQRFGCDQREYFRWFHQENKFCGDLAGSYRGEIVGTFQKRGRYPNEDE